MARLDAAHGAIEYEVEGRDDGRPLVLVTGLGSQLVRWSPVLRDALVDRGFRVIRLDNRDAGLSHRHDDAGRPSMSAVAAAVKEGRDAGLAYGLGDMADDVATLLDALGIDRAHIVGTSMGGYIAQFVAIRHPQRVASLTLVMTSTGNPALPGASPEVATMMGSRSGAPMDREAQIQQNIANSRLIGSPGYPPDEAKLRARIETELDRGFSGDGYLRQRAAIMAAGDRRADLAHLDVPTAVIHGTDDPLVRVEAGRDVAASIPGATITEFPGMGHEIPEALVPDIVAIIDEVSRRASSPARAEAVPA